MSPLLPIGSAPLTRRELMKLGHGDVILYGLNQTPRRIMIGPRDTGTGYFHFAIMKRSWTNRTYTLRHINELFHARTCVPILKPSPEYLCGEEKERLKRSHFRVKRDVLRDLDYNIAENERLGAIPGWWRDFRKENKILRAMRRKILKEKP